MAGSVHAHGIGIGIGQVRDGGDARKFITSLPRLRQLAVGIVNHHAGVFGDVGWRRAERKSGLLLFRLRRSAGVGW